MTQPLCQSIRSTAAWLAAALVLCLGASARAQRGIEVHQFEPTVDAYGFFTVERTDTTPPAALGFKLTIDYANQPLSASLVDPITKSLRRSVLMDWQLVGSFGITLGLAKWLAVLMQAPVSMQSFSDAYGQPGEPGTLGVPRTGFFASEARTNIPAPNAGPLDLRLGLKARFVRFGPLGLGALAEVTLPFGDSSAFLGDAGFTFRPRLVADLKLGRFTAAVNLGAIVRQTTRVLDPVDVGNKVAAPHVLLEIGHELTWSVAAGFRLNRWLLLAAELYGYDPVAVSKDARLDHTLDILGGAQFAATREVGLSVGAGAGLLTGASRYDQVRVFAGVSWSPAPAGRTIAKDDVVTVEDDDGDGVPNRVDRCPNQPEDLDGFQDEDGCPDPDNDNDGIPDKTDKCPYVAEDKDGFDDADGCPDPDNDNDGIPDAEDRCPDEPETRNGIDDTDGCPDGAGVLAELPAGQVMPSLPQLLFAPGSSKLDAAARSTLDHVADRLNAYLAVRRVRIEGHSDPGEAEGKRRLTLSQERVDVVRRYLISRAVDETRLQAVGYGATRPVDDSNRPEGRARNRRVELIVVERQ